MLNLLSDQNKLRIVVSVSEARF